MLVRVHFYSGSDDFLVPKDILAIDFQRLVGGKIRRLEFL